MKTNKKIQNNIIKKIQKIAPVIAVGHHGKIATSKCFTNSNIGIDMLKNAKQLCINGVASWFKNPKIKTIIIDVDDVDNNKMIDPFYYDDFLKPNIITYNKNNNKHHLIFILNTPINKNNFDEMQKYKNTLIALQTYFNGDKNAKNGVCKNPFNEELYRSFFIHDKFLNIDDFNDYIDVPEPKKAQKSTKKTQNFADILTQKIINVGERNQSIFDIVRVDGYTKINRMDNQKFINYIYNQCTKLNNNLQHKLPLTEIQTIATSVANWTIDKMGRDNAVFIEKQRHRGRLSGIARAEKMQNNIYKLIPLLYTNKSRENVAKLMNISIRTLYNYINYYRDFFNCNEPISEKNQQQPLSYFNNKMATNIDYYLSDNFKLFAQSENDNKIPINTINRLLE